MAMHSFLTLMFFSLSCFIFSISHALNNGFSVELIHSDSIKSPLYQPTQNKYQRVANAFRHSINRVNHLTNTPKSTIIPANGAYLMTYSVGTPPFKVYGIVDTGSDLVLLKCKPCEQCNNKTTPIFDPSKSSSYKNNIPCLSKKCKSYDSHSCSKKKTCEYTIKYGDGSSVSKGDLSLETLTLDSTSNSSISFPKTVIGCGHKNKLPLPARSSGVVGLGFGPMSLITQLSSSIGGKFSYCLGPETSNSTSKLNFGKAAVVSGHGVVTTPLIRKDPSTYYFLTLEAISVGNQRVEFEENSNGGVDGNVFIDSGSTLTLLPSNIYNKLESAVIKSVKLKRVKDPNGAPFLCYSVTSDKYDFPIITAHFKGADVKLHPIGTFIPVAHGVVCLAFGSTGSDDIGIFGNLSQQNLLIGYDLQQNTVSFKSTDCTKPY